ncbi:MAG: DUF3783 domain-containing protein [Sphaerochaetaceae bacterium]|jgi:hypothetical protein|nr:DUF3783 domain-containing protein [Sphaerochaetaceae bacterium]MDY0372473.1 DUF3783 domain-containing protein [Sphaerochaetaceae bacterium]
MEETQKELENGKAIILHGFSREEIFTLIRTIKHEVGTPEDIAFAMTTPHSLSLKLEDVVKDVIEEHEYMKKHPPQKRTKKQD